MAGSSESLRPGCSVQSLSSVQPLVQQAWAVLSVAVTVPAGGASGVVLGRQNHFYRVVRYSRYRWYNRQCSRPGGVVRCSDCPCWRGACRGAGASESLRPVCSVQSLSSVQPLVQQAWAVSLVAVTVPAGGASGEWRGRQNHCDRFVRCSRYRRYNRLCSRLGRCCPLQ
ncbi:MAG: hypothetical protein RLZZ436_2339 [Planctomycetota bacterium]